MPAHGAVRVGISGWTYPPWRGKFYPGGLRQKDELAYATAQFRSIEINGTFYSQQTPQSFARWAAETPEDFVFAVKGPRYITHMRQLKDIEAPLANFMATGLLRLGSKLGPILWQFPPGFRFEPERIERFFKLLPRGPQDAAAMARRHDHRLRGKAWTKSEEVRPLRHAMEIRHESFVHPDFIALLRAYDVALVCADTVEWPRLMDVTSDFVYCRLHGSEVLYTSGYDEASLRRWQRRIRIWAAGGLPSDGEHVVKRPPPERRPRDVFVYFDNDMKVRAPADAARLVELLGDLAK